MKRKFFKFYQDLYHQEFVFLPNWKMIDIFEVFGEPVTINDGGATFLKNGVICIWLKDFNLADLEFLTHESVHAANMLFTLRGQKVSATNDEAQAYLVQWIFGQCLKHLKSKKK
jgi:hypothetical protein